MERITIEFSELADVVIARGLHPFVVRNIEASENKQGKVWKVTLAHKNDPAKYVIDWIQITAPDKKEAWRFVKTKQFFEALSIVFGHNDAVKMHEVLGGEVVAEVGSGSYKRKNGTEAPCARIMRYVIESNDI